MDPAPTAPTQDPTPVVDIIDWTKPLADPALEAQATAIGKDATKVVLARRLVFAEQQKAAHAERADLYAEDAAQAKHAADQARAGLAEAQAELAEAKAAAAEPQPSDGPIPAAGPVEVLAAVRAELAELPAEPSDHVAVALHHLDRVLALLRDRAALTPT